MNSKRIGAVVIRQLFLLRHNWTRFFNIFLWIILDVFLWGFITKYLDTVSGPEFSFVPVFLGAIVLWDFMTRVQQGVMLAFFEDMWTQNFMNYFASPLSINEYIVGLVATSIITSTAGLAVMLLLAATVFSLSIFQLGFLLVPFILTLFIFGLALGVFACAIVLRLGPSAEWFAWPIPFILGPLAGVFYPIETLPAFLEPVARIIPPSYVFEGMRGVLFHGEFSVTSLTIGIGLSLVYLLLAVLFFRSIYRHVLRSGLLSRFSAEMSS